MGLDGPLAGHMAVHIALMSGAAPVLAFGLKRVTQACVTHWLHRSLAAATLTQIGMLWAWHTPGMLVWAIHSPAAHALMQVSLLVAALWFWSAILDSIGAGRWRAIFALLFTGKLFCLLGILLVFAPRLLYPDIAAGHVEAGLEDQQLAGLLMIVACPLTYVLAGTVIAARWIADLDAESCSAAPFPQAGRLAPE